MARVSTTSRAPGRLLEVVRRQPDLGLRARQPEAAGAAARSSQGSAPGQPRPDPLDQPAEDHPVGRLHAGLERAPDREAGVGDDGLLRHVARRDQRLEERAVLVRRDEAAGVGLGGQRLDQRPRLGAGALGPEPVRAAARSRRPAPRPSARCRATCSASGARPAAASGSSAARSHASQAGAPRRLPPGRSRRARPTAPTAARRAASSVSKRATRRRCGPRPPGALATSGCFRSASSASGVSAAPGQAPRPAAAAPRAGSAPAAARRCRRG